MDTLPGLPSRMVLWHQACPWCLAYGPFSAGSWEGPTPLLLQLQPLERQFVTGGAGIWGTMAALHVPLCLPGCSHQLALPSHQAAAQALTDSHSRRRAGWTSSKPEYPPSLSFHLLGEG